MERGQSPTRSPDSAAACPVVGRTSVTRLLELPDGHPLFEFDNVKFLGLNLKPGVSAVNFGSFLAATFVSILLFVFLNGSQSFLLSDIIHLSKEVLGRSAGGLSFADELFSLFAVVIWGIVSDFVGRRTVYSVGYILMGLGLALYPLMGRLLPDLLLARLVFAFGGSSASAMLTAVLSDYGTEDHRGRMAGVIGMASGLGAVTGALVMLRLPGIISTEWFHSPTSSAPGLIVVYESLAGFSILFAILLFFGMKRTAPAYHIVPSSVNEDEPNGSEHRPLLSSPTRLQLPEASTILGMLQDCPVAVREPKSLYQIFIDGALAARSPSVLLGYLGSALARGDSIIITLFLSLWINKYFETEGLCPGFDPLDPKGTCRAAYVLASSLSGMAQMAALLGAPLIGYLVDRVYKPYLTLVSLTIAGLGYFLLSILDNPTSPILYPVVILIGLGEIAMIVVSLSLTTSSHDVPRESRGSVAGFSSLFGAFGILATTQIGGWLFDEWSSTGPFLLMAVAHAIALVFAVVVVLKDASSQHQRISQSDL
ncbi:hypothetical protein SmJEL517_g02060 [Synchytrium microbalum]|uniref:Major facilitator superfamily (MFS) profile domain-containing protein n=1 Tax=Synchytrium microbalum TaxID=1806994 RepID=A0A507C8S2_9FUNG|nr:uncharacterized protein SmJEL517_g02060 [Synchytrium microbalum]TPX35549.1 hypothetical protein SmJEL517_g02060 [Synchytrium microbalum]